MGDKEFEFIHRAHRVIDDENMLAKQLTGEERNYLQICKELFYQSVVKIKEAAGDCGFTVEEAYEILVADSGMNISSYLELEGDQRL